VVELKVVDEPIGSTGLGKRRALVDASSVLDHDGGNQPAIFSAPPTGNPIASALFLEGSVAEEGN
jgi:hypothetical protein